ncbi:hypothetical protein ACQ86G_29330 [Roseateles chitinivorans]|uniref:hypothetical protein n=1 Tax=Roseateles chitinivorans TaxID=2917965 RepID=UPI003D6688BB
MWSPTGLFEDVEFRSGINLIIGKYADARRNEGPGINGVGKSSIVRMIDFLLLADWSRHVFAKDEYAWISQDAHSACLRLTVAGKSIQIRRGFGKAADEVGLRIGDAAEEVLDVRGAKALLGEIFFPPRSGSIGADGGFASCCRSTSRTT